VKNMKTLIHSIFFLICLITLCVSIANAQTPWFNTVQSGDWNDVNTWQMYDGINWYYPAPYTPTIDSYTFITDGITVTVTADVTVDSVVVEPGGVLNVNPGVTLSTGPSGQYFGIFVQGSLIVYGTLFSEGVFYYNPASTVIFADGSKYIHAQNNGNIPLATWEDGSTCEITGYVSGSKPYNANKSFYNFTWDCPGQAANIDLGWNNITIEGNITINNTGAANSQLRMTSPSAGTTKTITIMGDVIVNNGDFASNGSSSTGTIIVNHYGNILVTGGLFSASRGSGPTVIWNLYGNFTVGDNGRIGAGGTGAGSSKFVFAKSGTQIISFDGWYYNLKVSFEIAPGSTLQLATYWEVSNLIMAGGAIDLNGYFLTYVWTGSTLTYSASTPQITTDAEFPYWVPNLDLSNSAGVTIHAPRSVGYTLTLGGNNSYTNLNYITGYSGVSYAASVPQTTGPELPSNLQNLTINNPNGVTLSASEMVFGTLTLTSGKLMLGANNLKTRSIASSTSSYVATNGVGTLTVESIGATAKKIPIGTATSINPVTILNSPGAVDDFTVRVDVGVYDPLKCDSSHAVKRTWTITKGVSDSSNITLTFQWNAGETGSKLTGTKVVWRYDTSWTQVGSYGSGTYSYTGTVGPLLNLARFTVGDTGIVPIQIVPPRILPSPVYVSPAGNDANSGTITLPYKTLTKALSVAVASSMIYLRGGTYSYSVTEPITKIGLVGYPIRIWAYPGETPVLDFSSQYKGNTTSYDGVSVSGSYIHIKGIEVKQTGHNGIYITGSNNIIENCRIHDNTNTGLHIRGVGASNNIVLNCDSYFNFDSPGGGNADGFSAKWDIGTGNVFKGCRSYNNSDDGWDLWDATNTVVIDSCWAFRNGVDSWHTGFVDGNGNGFKLGGDSVATPNIVRNCVAFDNYNGRGNGGKGFDENNNLAGQTLYNCTSYRNTYPNFSFRNDPLTSGTHTIKNCISYAGGQPDNIKNAILATNSWQGFIVSDVDFVSLDTAQALAPRNSDGSLPGMDFLHLADGSPMVNAGTVVGLPYYGTAPDLGAFENGVVLPVQLTSFNCRAENSSVTLIWNTATEVSNYGFEVERRTVGNLQSQIGNWIKVAFIPGHGTSNVPHEYSYADKNLDFGRYTYRLKQIDHNGAFEYSQSIEVEVGNAPRVLALKQNYPNPFNPTTEITFSVPVDGRATLKVYNVLGQEVTTLFDDIAFAGKYYQQRFNASGLSTGMYISVLKVGEKQLKQKMVLMK
jgi:hypothetical protein